MGAFLFCLNCSWAFLKKKVMVNKHWKTKGSFVFLFSLQLNSPDESSIPVKTGRVPPPVPLYSLGEGEKKKKKKDLDSLF